MTKDTRGCLLGGALFCCVVLAVLGHQWLVGGHGESPAGSVLRRLMTTLLVEWDACVTTEQRVSFCKDLPDAVWHMPDIRPDARGAVREMDYGQLKRYYNVLVETDADAEKWAVFLLGKRRWRRPLVSYIVTSEREVHRRPVRFPRDATTSEVFRTARDEVGRGEWYIWDSHHAIARKPRARFVPVTIGPADSQEGVAMQLSVRNLLNTEIVFPSQPANEGSASYEVHTPSNRSTHMKVDSIPEGESVRLGPGEGWSGVIPLSEYFDLTTPGDYTCTIVLPVTFENAAGRTIQWEVKSNGTKLPVPAATLNDPR